MSTRKIATVLGTAVLLIGGPATFALAGQDGPGKPDRPASQCSDGIDNDGDGAVDVGADADCGSANDNSEGPEEPGNGPGTVIGPVASTIGAVKDALFPEEEPPAEEPPAEEPPAEEPPAEDPLAPVVEAVEDVVGQLPPLPSQEELEAAVAEVVGQLPPPPAV